MRFFVFSFTILTLVTATNSVGAFAQAGRAENVVDGMLMTATPKIGKWMAKKTVHVARGGADGLLSEKEETLGDCPLEIVDVQRVALYKVDDKGKPIRDSNNKLVSDGWIYQQGVDPFTKKRDLRYFGRRRDKNEKPVLEQGGKVGDFEYQKDALLGSYYSIDVKVDHFGIGRLEKVAPNFPMRMMPSKAERHLSRYDNSENGRPEMRVYNVQEILVGMQGESIVVKNGVSKTLGHGKANEPFYKIEIKFDTETLEPVHLTYTAGIADNEEGDNWLFADTAEYMCSDFKKVK
jgi:hypothetical protein